MSSQTDTVRQLLKLYESFNTTDVVKLFDKNATYQFANFPPAVGIDQIRQAAASSHLDAITSAKFDVQDMIELGDGVVVCEMIITYGTKDGRTIKLPCSDLFRFNDQGLIKEMKIYMDPGPMFAPPPAV
jgi:ketosteroid isomerase-like protein